MKSKQSVLLRHSARTSSDVASEIAKIKKTLENDLKRLQVEPISSNSGYRDAIHREAWIEAERHFGKILTEALAEKDVKIVEVELEANKRSRLLDTASEAAARFEKALQEANAQIEIIQADSDNRLKLLEESTRAAEALERELGELRSRHSNREIVTEDPGMDIVRESDPIVLLGSSWYDPEKMGDRSFRWIGGDARFNVAQLTKAPYTLYLDVEPGPGVGSQPFSLGVYEGSKKLATLKVTGLTNLKLDLGSGKACVRELTLRAEGGGKSITAPNDTRRLDYRVFKLELSPARDVVSQAAGLRAGHGWYPLETFDGETFRWAGEEVTIEAQTFSDVDSIYLDVEPGPGVGSKPFKLSVLSEGKPHAQIEVKGRQRIEIMKPTNGATTLKLRAEGGGKTVPSDPRVMNFRAFALID